MLQDQTAGIQRSLDVEVAHSIPGRVRLRLAPHDCAYAQALILGLQAHPGVFAARWNPRGRSLIVLFDPTLQFVDLPWTRSGPEAGAAPLRQIDWAKIAFSCLVSLIPLGPVTSVAFAFVTSVIEQSAIARPRVTA
jgi:hypothetical protein